MSWLKDASEFILGILKIKYCGLEKWYLESLINFRKLVRFQHPQPFREEDMKKEEYDRIIWRAMRALEEIESDSTQLSVKRKAGRALEEIRRCKPCPPGISERFGKEKKEFVGVK